MLHLRKSIIFVLLFVLSACSPKVSFEVLTPEASTPTVAPSATPVVEPIVQSVASPTFVPQAVAGPTDFSPVLYGGNRYDQTVFLLLGGVSNSEWLTPDMSVTRYGGEATYSLHSLTQASKYSLWGEMPEFSPTCKIYTVGTEARLDETGFVAVLDGWNIQKRPVSELSAEGEFYQQAVLDWLTTTEGMKEAEIGTLQVIRVDLEGDGTDEIFISATRLDGQITKAGDYSIVLMRKVIENDIVTKLVAGEVYHSKDAELTFPRTYSLANFIDLNQDGVLEVVVGYLKWEGFGARVYQANGQDLRQVLQAGC
jgi:hypothetical protein